MGKETIPEKVFSILETHRGTGQWLIITQIDKEMYIDLPTEYSELKRGSKSKIYNSMHLVKKLCDAKGLTLLQRYRVVNGKQRQLEYAIAVDGDERHSERTFNQLKGYNEKTKRAIATNNVRLDNAPNSELLPESGKQLRIE